MLPAPSAPRTAVRPDLCPFRDRMCRERRCPTCTPGASTLTRGEKRERLLALAASPEYSERDRAIFGRAAADLQPAVGGELVHVPGARRVRAPQTAPLGALEPFVARVLGEC